MDPIRTLPISSGLDCPLFSRKPHHLTSREDKNACQQIQPLPMLARNGTSQQSFGGDPAFSHLAKTADESSPTADAKVDEGGRKMTYAELIRIAFLSRTTKQMGLRELYNWFEQNTRKANKLHQGWKNSVRSN
ncbi:hypothetical protein LZ30DRAFT_740960, partial [Colletotrichum cereale]